MEGQTATWRMIRDLVIDAEVETAALYLRVDDEKRETLRRVLAVLVVVRDAIGDGGMG
jgi:hypothetical protein